MTYWSWMCVLNWWRFGVFWRSQRANRALYQAANREDSNAQAGLKSYTSASETQVQRNTITHQGTTIRATVPNASCTGALEIGYSIFCNYLHGHTAENIVHLTITLTMTVHCVQKKTPTNICFHISMSDVYRFKQKLQWIYLRNGKFWQCKN